MSAVRDILFLAHRIPYPPDKGDKIRSWHFLAYLAQRYRVHLACFIDDPADRQHVKRLQELCADCFVADLDPLRARLRCGWGMLDGAPLTLHYYRHGGLQRWVSNLLSRGAIDTVLAYSSAMAQYVMAPPGPVPRRVMDFVDIDSDKWRQYAATKSGPSRWVYRRESAALLAFERKVSAAFDASLFVSAAEAEAFRELDPDNQDKIFCISNGVDLDYFSVDRHYDDPYQGKLNVVVFTGAMDYWPNVDAVTWFARESLPLARKHVHDLQFYIVGSNPAAAVRALADLPGVSVTGRVTDVRPFLSHAAAVVAPLRVSRGVQNKVLEGLAMAKTVVSTPQALEGISVDEQDVMIAHDSTEFADRTVSALNDRDGAARGRRARERVLKEHSWATSLARLDALLVGRCQRESA